MSAIFPTSVYVLCFLASSGCAWLLGRQYAGTGVRLLLWASVCFALLAMNNLLLVVDLVMLPEIDLRLFRLLLALAAVCSLLFAFTWDLED